MKTLYLVRHAKSSWDSSVLTDIERPLNDRGKHDAPLMARRLLEHKVHIDQFVSSPAKRAKRTAEYFMEIYDRRKKELVIFPSLYEASLHDFQKVISDLQDEKNSVALFSHNGGITDFANSLTTEKIENMPTCSIFAVTSDVKNWSRFMDEKKDFLFFDYPKKDQDR